MSWYTIVYDDNIGLTTPGPELTEAKVQRVGTSAGFLRHIGRIPGCHVGTCLSVHSGSVIVCSAITGAGAVGSSPHFEQHLDSHPKYSSTAEYDSPSTQVPTTIYINGAITEQDMGMGVSMGACVQR